METDGKDNLRAPLLRPSEDAQASPRNEKNNRKVMFRIRGIECASCAVSIESAIGNMKGIESISVSPIQGQAVIRYRPAFINAKAIKEAIEDLNYEVDEFPEQEISVCRLRIKGMACTSCSESVERALLMVDGVKKAVVGLALEEAKIHFDPNITDSDHLIEAIEDAGFGADLISSGDDLNKVHLKLEGLHSPEDSILIQSSLEAIEGVNHVEIDPMGQKVTVAYDPDLTGPRSLIKCIQETGQGPNFFNARFYVGSYHALKRGSSNMDVLVALGTNAAYFYSVYIVIKASTSRSFEGQDFFETSAMLISFILLGKYLEVMAKGKTSDALAKLTDLAPETALLLNLNEDGNVISEIEISTQLLQRNDVIKIVPGAKVPVDGIVIDGQSHVNESMITGEAKPIAKRPGDKVIGGTVNENGCILVKATHVGSETALSQIVQLVEAAQLARAPVQKLADKISRFFVPTVVVAAFLTWLGWFIPGEAHLLPRSWIPKAMDGFELALQFGISVLVVACPCALGLATPTAVMVATGKGASQGVLIKGGNALEKAHKANFGDAINGGTDDYLAYSSLIQVRTVVFDKTGTLTVGKPAVVHTKIFTNMPLQELCDLASAAEANSEHPLAKAVVGHAKKLHQMYGSYNDHTVEVKDFEVHPGAGVSANIGGKMVLVGNKRLMLAFQVPISPEANSEHPLAKAVVGHAKKLHQMYGSYNDHTVEVKDFEVHPGAGVSANIGGKMVLVGNKRLMLAFQVPISPEVQDYMSDTENLARTCVLVAIDGLICGAFAVSDPLKPEAGHVISFLSSMSISSIMVTGDNWATASAIARELGISTVFAETGPVGKAEKIKELQGFWVMLVTRPRGRGEAMDNSMTSSGFLSGSSANPSVHHRPQPHHPLPNLQPMLAAGLFDPATASLNPPPRGKGISPSATATSDDDDPLPAAAAEENGHGQRTGTGPGKKGSPWQRMKWTDEVVRLLIRIVAFVGDDCAHEAVDGKRKHGAAFQKKGKWKMVSLLMQENGASVSPQQCEDKFNDLNKRYKRLNDILGPGTSCMVVNDPASLESMPISQKAKSDVKKILSSKHLFYKEMRAYHGGQKIPDCPDINLQSCSLPQVASSKDGNQCVDGGKEEEEEEDEADHDEGDEEEGSEEVERGSFESFLAELDAVLQDPMRSPLERQEWLRMRALQLEEERLEIETEALAIERQRFKWQRFSSKKDREIERLRLENERLMLENERMMMQVRQMELELHFKRSGDSLESAGFGTEGEQGREQMELGRVH
ncbi:hypothetical protein COCNU_01G006800 [Cocos nucifera]|uniref:P-type Cu(+) transporter n=1 Tax=Cocos nucifera TaxID=13894 RepID=A0A8K0HUB2_COCNU|nr:hypothetical protein COCNU_01G006800 [Cocos nucifera]